MGLIALMLMGTLAGILLHRRLEQQESNRVVKVRAASAQLYEQMLYDWAVEQAQPPLPIACLVPDFRTAATPEHRIRT